MSGVIFCVAGLINTFGNHDCRENQDKDESGDPKKHKPVKLGKKKSAQKDQGNHKTSGKGHYRGVGARIEQF